MTKCGRHIPLSDCPNTPSFTNLWVQSVQVALQTQSVQAGQALPEGQFFLGVLPFREDQEVLVCHGTLLHVQAVSEPGDRLTLLSREGNSFVGLEGQCSKRWRTRTSGSVKSKHCHRSIFQGHPFVVPTQSFPISHDGASLTLSKLFKPHFSVALNFS